jgi:hypothetical protein
MPTEECQELKNIKYKTMLLNGNKKALSSVIKDVSNLDLLLDEETEQSKKESWNKLDKSAKMLKINEYIKRLTLQHKLSAAEIKVLKEYLSTNLDKKNLQKNKDVAYVKESGVLEGIPNLQFNNSTRKFTLKRQVQQSVLKSLGPTRKKKAKSSSGKMPIVTCEPQKSQKSHKPQK